MEKTERQRALRRAIVRVAVQKRWDNEKQTATSAQRLARARADLARMQADELRRRADETLTAAGLDPGQP